MSNSKYFKKSLTHGRYNRMGKSRQYSSREAIPPIIIIGMHRSGTTMITEMLQRLGLFVGEKLDSNCEPNFFLEMNDWMLRQCHGGWFHPVPISHLLEQPRVRELTVDYLRQLMNSPQIIEFTGVPKYIQGEGPFKASNPWGWKDPRNTFTLPIWLDIFPNAKVIHIYRNGIDVAASLHARATQELNAAAMKHEKRKSRLMYWFKRKEGGFTRSLRCHSLAESFSLWEEYVSQAFLHMEALPNEKLSIKFESFLMAPESILLELAAFCGLETSKLELSSLVGAIKPDRANAYQNKPDLMALFQVKKDSYWMKELGYSDSIGATET